MPDPNVSKAEIVFGRMRIVRCELVAGKGDPMPPIAEPGGDEAHNLDQVAYEVAGDDVDILNPGDGDLVIVAPDGAVLRHEGIGEVPLPPGTWRLLHAEDDGRVELE